MLPRVLAALLALGLPSLTSAETLKGRASVTDGDTLEIAGDTVRLVGIDAPELDQTCKRADGRTWPCGKWARDELRRLALRQTLTCKGEDRDRYGRLLAVCTADGRDLNAAMVEAGAAEAYRRYSTSYVDQEKAAIFAGLGIWQGDAEHPEAFRASGTGADPPQASPGDCVIKGNISGSGRIYHLPGQEDYAATRISERKGERWFCSEAEARAAGWRRAKR
jgi:endonuclease YncB( thermonuclease family)